MELDMPEVKAAAQRAFKKEEVVLAEDLLRYKIADDA
jgi:hypothetical protein